MKQAEFMKTLELLYGGSGLNLQYKVPAMLKLQFHLIARTDDICHIESADLREHEEFKDFAFDCCCD